MEFAYVIRFGPFFFFFFFFFFGGGGGGFNVLISKLFGVFRNDEYFSGYEDFVDIFL